MSNARWGRICVGDSKQSTQQALLRFHNRPNLPFAEDIVNAGQRGLLRIAKSRVRPPLLLKLWWKRNYGGQDGSKGDTETRRSKTALRRE
jgi:hypothetical protein